MTTWHPIATVDDVVPLHVFRGQLHGRELAVWRADDGVVNVWENRCLHRGVRLSIGTNEGAELVCRYHGWRYANRTGGCTYIPAHPADSPPRTIHTLTFPALERYGLVWTCDEPVPADDGPAVDELERDPFGLRSLPVDAPPADVLAALADFRFAPTTLVEEGACEDLSTVATTIVATGPSSITLRAEADGETSTVTFFVQPVDHGRSVIRPVLAGAPVEPLAVWRHHAYVLGRLVDDIETHAPSEGTAGPSLLESPVLLPTTVRGSTDATLIDVRVTRKWEAAASIAGFELEPGGGELLPAFQAGDHIDVHTPSGLVRQYSLTNAPGQTGSYRIGVKLDPASRGGSTSMHHDVAVGDELRISRPRNGFPLQRNVPRTLLIAGGIGVTPLLSMAQALDPMGLDFELHYFAAGEEHLAFADVLSALGTRLHRHLGLTPAETGTRLERLLADPVSTAQIYACGPPPMLDALRDLAARLGWADDAVHFEYFSNTTELDDSSSFTVELARSALTLEVPSGTSILDVVRAHGVSIVSSCEQGACGTCAVTVLDGEPHHQDVYLTESERSSGVTMLSCVSRARSDRLVLDL